VYDHGMMVPRTPRDIADRSTRNTQLELDLYRVRDPRLLSPQEIFDNAAQALLEAITEDPRFERKPAAIHADALATYLSMFANTKPDGGVIAVGMGDDGIATGCLATSTSHLNDIERAGDIHCPQAKCESKRVPVRLVSGEEDFVLLVRVYYDKNHVVKTVKDHAFARRGESRKKLDADEVRELQLEKGEVPLELERVPTVSYPQEFDMDLVAQYAAAYRKNRNLDDGHTAEDILALRHLGEMDGHRFQPNLACVLLFAKDPARTIPGCRIRFLRFEGEVEGSGRDFNPVKDIWIEGNIPTLIAETRRLLRSQLREFSRLGDDGMFYTAPECPEPAWHEAVVNACAHRSYGLSNMSIFIKMFDDKLVVESPGGFPGLVTPENIYEMHNPRNPYLMDAMYHLDFVRCAHEGTRRIRDSMLKLGLPEPEFRQIEISHSLVRVTLRNSIKQRKLWIDSEVSSIVGEVLSRALNDAERRAINFLAENERINVSQVQRLTQKSWPAAKKLLEKLQELGLLEHHKRELLDRDPQAYYTLRGHSE